MQIVFNLPHVFSPGSSPAENGYVLTALRKCLTAIQAVYEGSPRLKTSAARPRVMRSGSVVTWDLPEMFYPGSTAEENAFVLRALLDALTSIDTQYAVTRDISALYNSGVIYRRTSVWDSTPALYAKKYGDCKSLTAALIAQYRKRGLFASPVFRFDESRTKPGTLDFHILVLRGDGKFEDPSKVLGMGRVEVGDVAPGD